MWDLPREMTPKTSRDISKLFLNLQSIMTLFDIHPMADEDNKQVYFYHS